ncbi:N-acetylmuramoyl-L-alanine amidase [Anaerovorax odorimutans]|uniref:N-acetylmuramoyl-L-alanine amidase n=1 Tax=Anaerovorax odorimutans TaxID=109327 RepID=A0ABT1RKJ0_9FIRM|nr:N-acetylmuramoyl-L-alanine amidase [Anaerovorax odorimutans]MCQ4635697.1 N-acetylmuramoyl-L-alanine amidase [Anaerovorax odorimutans]
MAIKIFVDQGHNPQNPNAGAEANGVREQDITYDIGVRVAAILGNDPNFDVRLSRNWPEEQLGTSNATSLQARVYEANTWGADFFISLHCNSSTNTSASGSETYVYSAGSPAYTMGERILEGLNDMTGLRNRGVFIRPSLYVLRATSMPSVLVEMGYITNLGDVYLLTNDPESFAKGIVRGINLYYGFVR